MTGRLVWDRDGRDWPHRDDSRFVDASGFNWHVQILGDPSQRDVILLVHGTGASTHSWAGLAPRLAAHARVVMLDLPGHAFTQMPISRQAMSMPGMAEGITRVLERLELKPTLAVGHSAGAAILARMCLDRLIAPRALVSLNGALLPFRGVAQVLFSPLARLMATTPIFASVFARRASDRAAVERLLAGTGSRLSDAGIEYYRRLTGSREHVAAALAMMAAWDLVAFAQDLPRLDVPLLLVVGGEDRTVSPDEGFRVRDMVAETRVVYLRGLGHLMHEERPEMIAGIVLEALAAGHSPIRDWTIAPSGPNTRE